MKMKIAILAACASTFALSQADVARAYYGPTPDSSGVVQATTATPLLRITATPLLRINGQAVLDVWRIRVANKYADDFKQIDKKRSGGDRGVTTPRARNRTMTAPAKGSPRDSQTLPSKK